MTCTDWSCCVHHLPRDFFFYLGFWLRCRSVTLCTGLILTPRTSQAPPGASFSASSAARQQRCRVLSCPPRAAGAEAQPSWWTSSGSHPSSSFLQTYHTAHWSVWVKALTAHCSRRVFWASVSAVLLEPLDHRRWCLRSLTK